MTIATFHNQKTKIFVYERGCGKDPGPAYVEHSSIEDAREYLKNEFQVTDEEIEIVPIRRQVVYFS